MLFEVVTSSSSWTLPAHAALFTGLPDSVHRVDRGEHKLAPERRTLAESLQAAGYRTAGVWTGPLLDPRFGFGQGFDEYVSHAGIEEDWERAVSRSHQVVTGQDVLDKVGRLLGSSLEEPFFLFVHLWDVHYDYIPPAPYDSLFDQGYSGEVDGRGLVDYLKMGPGDFSEADLQHLIALYDAEIRWTDQQIGEILEGVEAFGGEAETMVVVTADHGEEFFEHGSFGHKRKLFDESIRIPLVVRYPGALPAGRRIGENVRIVDIAPTILELAGAEPLPDTMGRSLVPLIEGRSAPSPPPAVSELVVNPRTEHALLALRSSEWKLVIERPSGNPVGLWDLKDDPLEEKNVLGIDPELTRKAAAELRSTLDEIERLRQRHAVAGQVAQALPKDLQQELESLGYLATAATTIAGNRLRADPNPIQVCDAGGHGVTTLRWSLPGGPASVELRIGSPAGKLFANLGPTGSASTGKWVKDGMRFFLVDGTSREVLGHTTVQLTRSGCLAPSQKR